jgi:hypothetical protein
MCCCPGDSCRAVLAASADRPVDVAAYAMAACQRWGTAVPLKHRLPTAAAVAECLLRLRRATLADGDVVEVVAKGVRTMSMVSEREKRSAQ